LNTFIFSINFKNPSFSIKNIYENNSPSLEAKKLEIAWLPPTKQYKFAKYKYRKI